jgi:hypothetical protein
MIWETLFGACNMLVLAPWLALLLLPRWPFLKQGIRFGVIVQLAAVYAALVFTFFFRVEGGGFNSLAEVRTLFASDPLLLAGWIHYLAFDLFVGVWLAERLDAQRVSRFIQAPILVATFMFGPLGLLAGLSPSLVRSSPQPVRAQPLQD